MSKGQDLKLFEIKDVEWLISSDDIKSVIYNAMTERYHIFLKNSNYTNPIEISDSTWSLFKKEFPEHCIDIERTNDVLRWQNESWR